MCKKLVCIQMNVVKSDEINCFINFNKFILVLQNNPSHSTLNRVKF